MNNLFDVSEKVVVITGGSDGLGKMIASVFVANGAKVYIVGRKAEKTEAVAKQLTEAGPGCCYAIAANLADLDDVERVASRMREFEPEGINALVNNAGTTWGAPLDQFPVKGWDKVMDLNLKSVFYLTEALLPQLTLKASDDEWSRIINMSSIGARFIDGDIASPVYAASKAGVEQLTRILAKEHAKNRVTVNAIAPGWFPTNMTGTVEWAADAWKESNPVPRLGRAEDIGGTCLFLCSRAGCYLTGQVIDLDGGHAL